MLERFDITSDEFTEVIALHVMGPDVGDRVDFGLAQLCAVVASSSMGSKRTFSAEDFVPKWGAKQEQSDEDVLEMFRQMGQHG